MGHIGITWGSGSYSVSGLNFHQDRVLRTSGSLDIRGMPVFYVDPSLAFVEDSLGTLFGGIWH